MAIKTEFKEESQEVQRPLVGLSGIIMRKSNEVLMGKRKGSHGERGWSFGGGHLEYGESFQESLYREIEEETGLDKMNLRFIDFNPYVVTNDYFKDEGKHYVTLFMRLAYCSGEIFNMQPEKCDGWEWFEWDKLPSDLFLPVKNLIGQSYDPFRLYRPL